MERLKVRLPLCRMTVCKVLKSAGALMTLIGPVWTKELTTYSNCQSPARFNLLRLVSPHVTVFASLKTPQ